MEKVEIYNYWQYFLCLCDDFSKTTRYVEPGQNDVYSFEYAKLITLICSEIENICKLICKEIDSNQNPEKIYKYANIILNKYPKLPQMYISFSRANITISPWENWDKKTPIWWKNYQDIKHNRHNNFEKANYKNTLYSLGALYVLLLYLYKIVGIALPMDSRCCFYHSSSPQFYCVRGSGELPDFSSGDNHET